MLDIFAPVDHHPAVSMHRRHIRELSKAFRSQGPCATALRTGASLLFNFALNNDYVETNPASRMKCVGRPRV
jgi:hypothetical protein